MLDFFNETAFHLFGAATTWAEVLGFISGIITVFLIVKQNVWNFPIGIINNIFFLILFFDAKLYADGTLQIFYAVLAVVGWYTWLHYNVKEKTTAVSSDWVSTLYVLIFIVASTAVLHQYLVSVDDSAPFWDALTTSISLGATVLLNFKIIQTWYLWIAADVIYIPLYLSRDLILTAIVYVAFMCLCFAGLKAWRKDLPKREYFEGAKATA